MRWTPLGGSTGYRTQTLILQAYKMSWCMKFVIAVSMWHMMNLEYLSFLSIIFSPVLFSGRWQIVPSTSSCDFLQGKLPCWRPTFAREDSFKDHVPTVLQPPSFSTIWDTLALSERLVEICLKSITGNSSAIAVVSNVSLRIRDSDCKSVRFALWDLPCVDQHPFIGFFLFGDANFHLFSPVSMLSRYPEAGTWVPAVVCFRAQGQGPESRSLRRNASLSFWCWSHFVATLGSPWTWAGPGSRLGGSPDITWVSESRHQMVSPVLNMFWICWICWSLPDASCLNSCEFMAHPYSDRCQGGWKPL